MRGRARWSLLSLSVFRRRRRDLSPILQLAPQRHIDVASDLDWFWRQIAATVEGLDPASAEERRLLAFRGVLQGLSDQELVDFIRRP